MLTTTYRHHPFPSCLAHPFDNRPISRDRTISRHCTRRRRYVWDHGEPICIRLPSYLQIFLCTFFLYPMNPCTPSSCCACNATRYELRCSFIDWSPCGMFVQFVCRDFDLTTIHRLFPFRSDRAHPFRSSFLRPYEQVPPPQVCASSRRIDVHLTLHLH